LPCANPQIDLVLACGGGRQFRQDWLECCHRIAGRLVTTNAAVRCHYWVMKWQGQRAFSTRLEFWVGDLALQPAWAQA
jgi:hypothetical protein